MSMKRVVITGLGAVSPLGRGVDALFDGMCQGRSGVVQVPELAEVGGLGPRVAGLVQGVDPKEIPRKDRRSMSKLSIFALLAAKEALAQARVPDELLSSGRLGASLGSTVGSVDTMEEFFKTYLATASVEQVKSMLFFRIMGHSCAANVIQALGITGRTLAPSAACATGCQAIGLGYEAIASGAQDLMLCGGADEFHPLTAATFDIMLAASTGYNDRPDQTPRPFDRDRDGVVCAEGAGVLLLESLDSALVRGATILAEITGFGCTSDSANIANPEPAPVRRCMQAALESAGISASDIDYVNAHATGTTQGDLAESQALAELFGANVPVSSLKGYMGHTMAASGALESIATVEMLRTSRIVPVRNCNNPDQACADIGLALSLQQKEITTALKNNFALGGINAALIFRRYNDSE